MERHASSRPSRDRLLQIYLNDHLAASVGIGELVERTLSRNPDGALGAYLKTLLGELQEDREALRRCLRAIGGTEDPAKKAAAWFFEKVGRLKLNGEITRYSDLSRLEELEALALGLQGKKGLWKVLEELAGRDGRFEGIELSRLLDRVEAQLSQAEDFRREAARRAFHLSDPA